MDKFLVSIIIPTYNRPDLLKNAIRSALNQIYKEIEIIVVDDASTANNQSVIDSFDFEIKYHRFETNQGGNICRNKGVELSNGKYIAFLDDDDVWLQTKLEQQLILMQENDIDLSYTGKNIITVDENLKEKNRRYSFAKPKFTSLKKSIMYKNFIGTTSSIMIKKDKFLEVGGFDVKMPSLQDYEFYLRFIHADFKVQGINEGLVDYFIYQNKNAVSKSLKKNFNATWNILKNNKNKSNISLLFISLMKITLKKIIR